MDFVFCAMGGYLIGSLNPSYFISRIKGFDIRDKGTGNAGATNAMFTMGAGYGLIVMLFDVFKAYSAVSVARYIFAQTQLCGIITGIACMLGHIFPFYMKFKGGKGTACLAGIVLALTPILIIPMLMVAVLLGIVINRASILPIIAVTVYPFLYYIVSGIILDSAVLALLIPIMLYSHRKNFKRVKDGKESSFRDVLFRRNLDDCVERKDN